MADYYGTLAGALLYHADRGNSAWAASTDTLREAALVRASAYIDGAYRSMFPGVKTDGRDQTLEWPRSGAYDVEGNSIDSDEIPVEVSFAAYEGALRELATAGSLNPDIKPGGGVVSRVKAGSVEVEYAQAGGGATTTTFQRIEALLGGLIVMRSAYSGRSARA